MRFRADGWHCIIIAHIVQPWVFSLSVSIHIPAWPFIQQMPLTDQKQAFAISGLHAATTSESHLTYWHQKSKKTAVMSHCSVCAQTASCVRAGGRSHAALGLFPPPALTQPWPQDYLTWDHHRLWVTRITPPKWHWIVAVVMPISNLCPHPLFFV